MPRRNSAALKERTRGRYATTHVIIDTLNNDVQVGHGTKANCDAWAGVHNSFAHSWRYHVKPIHK